MPADDQKPAPPLTADPRALEAIARFEKRKPSPAARPANKPVVQKSARRKRILSVLATFLLFGIASIFALQWITGHTWQYVYSKLMTRQLAWYAPHYPRLKPVWWILQKPLVSIAEPKSLLLPRATADRADPTSKMAASLPVLSIAEFVTNARDGADIVLPPGRYTDCASIAQSRLTIRAEIPGTAQLDGGTCAGKAALITRGMFLVVDGLVFKNMRVPDGNGAGIRHESGSLIVRNSIFYNSENGILTNAGKNMSLQVFNSDFVRLGSCDHAGGCAHSIYAGEIATLKVSHARFSSGAGGHFLKSRAATVVIEDNSFDGTQGVASYLVDLSSGADGRITGNTFIKGTASRNRCCIIRIGGEGTRNDSRGLEISGNMATSRVPLTVFVWNDMPYPLKIRDNDFSGLILASW